MKKLPTLAVILFLPIGITMSRADRLSEELSKLKQVRESGDLSPKTIQLPPGRYEGHFHIDEALVGNGLVILGSPTAPESVVISAGRRVTDWKVEGGRWTATVDVPEVFQFFVNESPRRRCREPDEGFWRVAEVGPDKRTSFTWMPDSVPAVSDVPNTELLFLHDWSVSRVGVKSLDTATRTLTTTHPVGPPNPHYEIDHFEKNPRYALEGASDFLDLAGEWHFDRNKRVLTYLPLAGETPESVECTVPEKAQAMTIRGRPDKVLGKLRLEGLTFSHAHWQPSERGYAAGQATAHDSPPDGMRKFVGASVEVDFCQDLTLTKCLFRNSDGGGLWLREGCDGVAVTNCRFDQLGGNGIMIGESGNPSHLTHGVSVADSLIENCGTRYLGAVGVWIGIAADCKVMANEIRNLPYTGVSVGWRWNPEESPCRGHLIERNHIHHIMRILSDGAGIYTLGKQPGTILRGNHIHQVSINAGSAESNGIFMDEGSTDILVEGNHIHDIARSPIRFHRAGKNTLRGNKLVPAEGVPPLRFIRTAESDILVE